jgi:hypothetical protein
MEYFKNRIKKLESKRKKKDINDVYKSINEFVKCYQFRANVVKGTRMRYLRVPIKFE